MTRSPQRMIDKGISVARTCELIVKELGTA
jgi:hypothetical protein